MLQKFIQQSQPYVVHFNKVGIMEWVLVIVILGFTSLFKIFVFLVCLFVEGLEITRTHNGKWKLKPLSTIIINPIILTFIFRLIMGFVHLLVIWLRRKLRGVKLLIK